MAELTHHSARSRASLVIAQALHLAGRLDLAFPWYRKARDHAVAEGDDATTSALMHNMGWLRMMALRQGVLSGKDDCFGDTHALMNAESTAQFDALTGDISWEALKPILRAQIMSLQGNFAEALFLYEKHLADAERDGTTRLQANLLADKAFCLCMAGQFHAGQECALAALVRIGPETHIDDRAAAHSRLAQAFGLLADVVGEKRHLRLAREAWRSHEVLQERIVELLKLLSDIGDA